MKPLIVHGVWGDRDVYTYDKTLKDIEHHDRITSDGWRVLAFVWGEENRDFCEGQGVETQLVNTEPIQDFIGYGDSRRTDRDEPPEYYKGRINYGITMWRHKLEVIRLALGMAETVLWLDWDTQVFRQPDAELEDILEDGYEFQSRLRKYRHPQCPWRRRANKRLVFHGGCYYFRTRELLNLAIDKQESDYYALTDEVSVTWAIDKHYFWGSQIPHERYEDVGLSNPHLYCTRSNARQHKGLRPYFHEGLISQWESRTA